MPREHVLADLVTVRDGDLPYLGARSYADASRLVLPGDLLPAPAPSRARPVRLRATVGWDRDGGVVTLGVTGLREDDLAPGEDPLVDVGGYHAQLDWRGCNRLLAVLRRGRDGTCGAPE